MEQHPEHINRVYLQGSVSRNIGRQVLVSPLNADEALQLGDFFTRGTPQEGSHIFQYQGKTRAQIFVVLSQIPKEHGSGWTIVPDPHFKRTQLPQQKGPAASTHEEAVDETF